LPKQPVIYKTHSAET